MRRFGGIVAAAALAMLTTAAQAQVTETLTMEGTFRHVDTGALEQLTLDTQSEEAASWETIVGETYHVDYSLGYDHPWVTKVELYLEHQFTSQALADPPVTSLSTSADYVPAASNNARCGVTRLAFGLNQIEGEGDVVEDDDDKPTQIGIKVLDGEGNVRGGVPCRARPLSTPGQYPLWGWTEQDGTILWDVTGDTTQWWVLEADPESFSRCSLSFGDFPDEQDRHRRFERKQQATRVKTFQLFNHHGIEGTIEFETFGSGYWADVELWQDGQCVQDGRVDGDANEDGKYPYRIVPPPPAGTDYTIVATYRDEAPQEKPVDGGVPNNCDDYYWIGYGYKVLYGGGTHQAVMGPDFTFYGDGGQGGPH